MCSPILAEEGPALRGVDGVRSRGLPLSSRGWSGTGPQAGPHQEPYEARAPCGWLLPPRATRPADLRLEGAGRRSRGGGRAGRPVQWEEQGLNEGRGAVRRAEPQTARGDPGRRGARGKGRPGRGAPTGP